MNFNEINCRIDCGRCNHKGSPSVTKESLYCLKIRRELPSEREQKYNDGLFTRFMNSLSKIKGQMRAAGKINKNNQQEDK